MEQKAFDLIAEKVGETLAQQGFDAKPKISGEEDGPSALFTGESVAYEVLYRKEKKCFELRTCPVTENGPGDNWKVLATWGFDSETDSAAYAGSIAGDFAETLGGTSRLAAVQQAKRKRRKEEDSTTDPLFLFNRMAGIFPELRDDMTRERAEYGEIRNVAFAREKIVPKVEELAGKRPDSEPFKRLCGVLNDLYENGDMDVRSLITIVILNGISDEKALANIEAQFSDDLRRVYAKARDFRGRKVKPEKKKKMPKISADEMVKTLNDTR